MFVYRLEISKDISFKASSCGISLGSFYKVKEFLTINVYEMVKCKVIPLQARCGPEGG